MSGDDSNINATDKGGSSEAYKRTEPRSVEYIFHYIINPQAPSSGEREKYFRAAAQHYVDEREKQHLSGTVPFLDDGTGKGGVNKDTFTKAVGSLRRELERAKKADEVAISGKGSSSFAEEQMVVHLKKAVEVALKLPEFDKQFLDDIRNLQKDTNTAFQKAADNIPTLPTSDDNWLAISRYSEDTEQRISQISSEEDLFKKGTFSKSEIAEQTSWIKAQLKKAAQIDVRAAEGKLGKTEEPYHPFTKLHLEDKLSFWEGVKPSVALDADQKQKSQFFINILEAQKLYRSANHIDKIGDSLENHIKALVNPNIFAEKFDGAAIYPDFPPKLDLKDKKFAALLRDFDKIKTMTLAEIEIRVVEALGFAYINLEDSQENVRREARSLAVILLAAKIGAYRSDGVLDVAVASTQLTKMNADYDNKIDGPATQMAERIAKGYYMSELHPSAPHGIFQNENHNARIAWKYAPAIIATTAAAVSVGLPVVFLATTAGMVIGARSEGEIASKTGRSTSGIDTRIPQFGMVPLDEPIRFTILRKEFSIDSRPGFKDDTYHVRWSTLGYALAGGAVGYICTTPGAYLGAKANALVTSISQSAGITLGPIATAVAGAVGSLMAVGGIKKGFSIVGEIIKNPVGKTWSGVSKVLGTGWKFAKDLGGTIKSLATTAAIVTVAWIGDSMFNKGRITDFLWNNPVSNVAKVGVTNTWNYIGKNFVGEDTMPNLVLPGSITAPGSTGPIIIMPSGGSSNGAAPGNVPTNNGSQILVLPQGSGATILPQGSAPSVQPGNQQPILPSGGTSAPQSTSPQPILPSGQSNPAPQGSTLPLPPAGTGNIILPTGNSGASINSGDDTKKFTDVIKPKQSTDIMRVSDAGKQWQDKDMTKDKSGVVRGIAQQS